MNRRTLVGDTFTNTVLQLLRLSGLLQRAGDRIAKPAGQTAARWQVIGAIADQTSTVADIARRMALARQSVQRIANDLVAEGLAIYHDNPTHQRAKLVGLTASGRRALAVIRDGQCVWANRVGADMGVRKLKQLSALLQQLLDTLQNDPVSEEDS